MGFFALLQTGLGCGWSLTHHSKHSAPGLLAGFVRAILEALPGGQSSVVDVLCYSQTVYHPRPQPALVRAREQMPLTGELTRPSRPFLGLSCLMRHLSLLARVP